MYANIYFINASIFIFYLCFFDMFANKTFLLVYTGLDDKSEQMTNRNDLLVRAFLDQFQ